MIKKERKKERTKEVIKKERKKWLRKKEKKKERKKIEQIENIYQMRSGEQKIEKEGPEKKSGLRVSEKERISFRSTKKWKTKWVNEKKKFK